MIINAAALLATLAFAPMQEAAPAAPVTEPAPSVSATDPTPIIDVAPAAEISLEPIPEVTDDELILGETSAPVTLVAYTSMICIQCAAWHVDVLPRLIEEQIATGRVRFVLRQLPTTPVQVSSIAAGIIRCAAKDNQMNVAGALFENLQAFREGPMTDLDWYQSGVAVSGRSREEVETCLTDPATLLAIQETARAARVAGVTNVPTLFVNGTAVSVATAEDIALAIELLAPAT